MTTAFDYENDEDFKAADQFARTFEPKGGVDYGWVWSYAEVYYRRMVEAKDRIEKKADAIVNYFGAFGGLLVIVFVYATQVAHWTMALATIPTLVCCMLAMRYAICARSPMTVPAPPEIKNAIEFAEAYDKKAQATFIPRFAAASLGMEAVNNEKSRLVECASLCLLWAMGLLFLPLIAGIVQAIIR